MWQGDCGVRDRLLQDLGMLDIELLWLFVSLFSQYLLGGFVGMDA